MLTTTNLWPWDVCGLYHADRFRVRRRPGTWAACWEEGVLCAIAVHSGWHCGTAGSELRYLSNSTMGTQPGTMVPYLSTMILEQGTRSTYKATTRMWPHTQIESCIWDFALHLSTHDLPSCANQSAR